jgi:hypothetical protein
VAADAEGVVHDGVDLRLARLVRDVVEVSFRVGLLEVDGGRDDFLLDGLDAEDEFGGACRYWG